jgi:hypothetical protein
MVWTNVINKETGDLEFRCRDYRQAIYWSKKNDPDGDYEFPIRPGDNRFRIETIDIY